jgi:hypothetical protein
MKRIARGNSKAISLELLLLLLAANTIPTVRAEDICHGRGAAEDIFFGSDAEFITCLNGGGLSGLTINGDQLTYSIRKTDAPVRLRDVIILQLFSSADAAFVTPKRHAKEQCDAIRDTIKRGACNKILVLPNDIDLESVQAGSLDFSKTVFLGKVKLSNVTSGMIWLDGSVFVQSLSISRPMTSNGISLSGIVAEGRVDLSGVTNYLSIIGGEYQGPFVGDTLKVGQFYVKEAVFWGNTQFGLTTSRDAFIYETIFKSDLDMRAAKIGTPATPAALTIASTEVAGEFDLRDVSISGELRLGANLAAKAQLDGLTAATRCTINVDCR